MIVFKEYYKLIKLSLSKKPESKFWKDAFEFIKTKKGYAQR